MTELHEGPLTSVQPQTMPGPSRRDARRIRRRRRHRGEEILGWILVPLMVVGLYWGITAGFEALGTSPGLVWDQLMQVKAMMEKRS